MEAAERLGVGVRLGGDEVVDDADFAEAGGRGIADGGFGHVVGGGVGVVHSEILDEYAEIYHRFFFQAEALLSSGHV